MSNGPVERALAAYNLGVALATTGELAKAELAFTRAFVAVEMTALRDKHKVKKGPTWHHSYCLMCRMNVVALRSCF